MVVILILSLLLAIVVPYYVKQRATAQSTGCINNLFKIEAAADQFALEKGLKTGDHINFPGDVLPYIKATQAGQIPPCPAGGVYALDTVGSRPTCTLSTLADQPHILP